MAATGDSLLVRAGLVRPDQLAEAQRLRAKGGGTVGEWLVRLGAVSEEQLVDFYHLRLLVPRIADAQFARVSAEALAAVPVDMALEFRVFPIALDVQNTLTLAMADPADTHVAEEVAFYSGRACHRAVASASAIQAAIERHYRPRSFTTDRPSPGGSRPTASMMVAVAPEPPPTRQTASMMIVQPEPPAPAPAPRQTASMTAVVPEPATSTRPTTPMMAVAVEPPPESPPPLPGARQMTPLRVAAVPRRTTSPLLGMATPRQEHTEEPLLLTQVKPEPAAPEASPRPVADEPSGPSGRQRFVTQTRAVIPHESAPPVEQPIPLTRATTPPPLRPPTPPTRPAVPPPVAARNRARTLPGISVTPEFPVEAMRNAATREAIGEALLAFGAQIAPAAALLVMRKGALVGQEGRGAAVDQEAVRQIVASIDEPSLLRDVVQSRLPYRGPLADTGAHRAVLAALGRPVGEALLLPICVSDKAIGVLVAAGMAVPLPEAGLAEFAREAGQAYERLIRSVRR